MNDSQHTDMKCRECGSGYAAETSPRGIEPLLSAIFPINKYRCRGCYTRQWHFDHKIFRWPRLLFWTPFWVMFIYSVVQDLTRPQPSYEQPAASIAEPPEATPAPEPVENPDESLEELLARVDEQKSLHQAETEPVASLAVTEPDNAPDLETIPVNPEAAVEIETIEISPQDTSAETHEVNVAAEQETAPVITADAGVADEPSSQTQVASVETTSAQPAEVEAEAVTPQKATITEPEPVTPPPAPEPEKDAIAWLFTQDPVRLTIQVGSYKTAETAIREAAKLKLADDPLLSQQRSSDGQWHYLLYGNYGDKAEAEAAASDLGIKQPWIRSFAALQKNRCKNITAGSDDASYCSD